MRILSLTFLLFSSIVSYGQGEPFEVVDDLSSGWKTFQDGEFIKLKEGETTTRTIYFDVDPGRYRKSSVLKIECAEPVSVYLNYKLVSWSVTNIRFDLDSLAARVALPWTFGVYSSKPKPWLRTTVLSVDDGRSATSNPLRPVDHFLNFSILASIIILIFFAALLQTNPRLTFDYFNFIRLFSIQEREDSLLNSRISSSVNILFYGFASMLTGFVLLTLFHFGSNEIPLAEYFPIASVGEGFWQWLKLSTVAAVVLIGKIILLSMFTSMFDLRDVTGLQFYNFVRLAFFILTVSLLMCLCYFVFKIQNPDAYNFLLNCIVVILFFWVFVVGLKLMSRTTFRFFHLFSYLCASELIPVIILVKVL
ncbi:MAG: DUF4271 domain-containing protein, partial [Cyclobacteriaceae bacterium]|nr:DUF4271 domain-containing protein [Cyclobacteriaceae bacterium]